MRGGVKKKQSSRLKSAFIIPYILIDGEILFLLGQKQVISFRALLNPKGKNRENWKNVEDCIEVKKSPFQDIFGEVKGMDKRFFGILLPGGGKPSFFGGRIERGKTPQQTAIREFKEELHCDFPIKEQDLIEILRTDWGGVYYAFNFHQFYEKIDLSAINHKIKRFNGKYIELQKIREAKINDLPEMYKIDLLTAPEIKNRFSQIDKNFIRDEIIKFSQFVFTEIFGIKKIETDQEKFDSFVNNIYRHFIENEWVDSNLIALNKINSESLKNNWRRTIHENLSQCFFSISSKEEEIEHISKTIVSYITG